jgi:glutamate carboxypeptidase
MEESWRQQEEGRLELLERLVDVNSHSDNLAGVDAVRRLLAGELAELGLAVEEPLIRPQGSPRPRAAHLVARWPAPGRPRVLLIGHLDTVFPVADAFAGLRRDGLLLRGPGVGDIKGGDVAIVAALQVLRDVGAQADVDVTVFMGSDEEVGSHASRDMIRQLGRQADVALGFEPAFHPPGESVARHATVQHVVERKGCGRFNFELHGVAAHSGGAPQLGASAVEALARKVTSIHALTDFERGLTTNVGLVSGGRSANTVAPSARGEVDFRFRTEEEGGQLAARIREVLEREERVNAQLARGVTCEIEAGGGVLWPPLVPTAASRHVSQVVAECCRRWGLAAEGITRGGASDAAHVASVGTPAVCGLGPVTSGIHTDAELTSVPALRHSVLVGATVLLRLGQG